MRLDYLEKMRSALKAGNEVSGNTAKNEKRGVPSEKPPLSRGRIVVVTSGKGGVGKTTMSCAMASSLCVEMNRTALVIDMDAGLRNTDIVSGMGDRVAYTSGDVMEGRVDLCDAIVESATVPGFFLLPAPQEREFSAKDAEAFGILLRQASRRFDVVFIDCPAGIGESFETSVKFADEAIVVVTPELPSLRAGARVVRLLDEMRIAPVSGILNRCFVALASSGKSADVGQAERVLGIPFLGFAPMDIKVVEAFHSGVSLATYAPDCPAMSAIGDMATEHFSFLDESRERERIVRKISVAEILGKRTAITEEMIEDPEKTPEGDPEYESENHENTTAETGANDCEERSEDAEETKNPVEEPEIIAMGGR